MDFDPANRDVPTPRYELESGSEDELEAETSTRRAQEPLRLLKADGSDAAAALEPGSKLVILVGGAGMALLGSLGGSAPAQQYTLQADGEQHAGVGVVDSTAGDKLSVAVVAPPPSTHSSRFHSIAKTLLEATKPCSVVIVDSYSPQDQLHRSAYESDEDAEWDAPIKYLASPRFLASNKVDARRMVPLRAPEAASGVGAAFLSEAVVRDVPAILTLLEDVSFQSHVQLYGSLGSALLSTSSSQALAAVTGLGTTKTEAPTCTRTILDFATSRRTQPAANLAVLGDGNMYI